MSRIVRFHKVGGPEVLKIENLEVPPPGKGEVRMQVKALGLNRAEAMFRLGQYLQDPVLPSRLGYEAAGIVEAVGQGVKDVKPGDVVSVYPSHDLGKYGVYGEIANVPAECVVKHPASLNFEQAAAIWMQYLTAYGALIQIAKLTKGDHVVITAASSSVGIAAIQLANLVGAIPIATTRSAKKKKDLEKVGAKHVIVTDDEKVSVRINEITKGKGARVVFDPIGGSGVTELAEGTAFEGIIIEYGALSPEPTPFPLFTALKRGLTIRGYVLFEVLSNPEKTKEAVQYVLAAINSGKLRPVIAKTFKLDEIVEAHKYMESNQQFGKIIVTV